MSELRMFDDDNRPAVPSRMGGARTEVLERAQILTPARGFLRDFDYSLNPYVGCRFGCAYCYAAFFVPSVSRRENWGRWVDIKVNAASALRQSRRIAGKRIYMSSVTDPYQPIESRIELSRAILEVLCDPARQPRLVIQTRSPLVTRDIDLLKRFAYLRVNVTVTTDSEAVRKRFEPACPSNERRLEALAELQAAGIKTSVTITPMLPLEDPKRFARRLASLNAAIYVAQAFHSNAGAFAAGTRSMARDIAEDLGWSDARYREAFAILRKHLPHLYEGREGFPAE